MALEDFLQQERSAGEAVSENAAFTLDPEQVRRRVATFCKEHRLYPLLRCLQAIVRVTESDLFIRFEKGRWLINFLWGSAPEKEAFAGLVGLGTTEGFDRIPHTASQHFFFALSAALGQEQYGLEWETPRGGFSIKEGKLETNDETSDMYCQLRFWVDEGWWKHLTGRDSYETIHETLQQRLCYAPIPIHVEREMLEASPPRAPERPWASSLLQGSQLAWRLLRSKDVGRVRVPKLPLDRYRVAQKGTLWFLLEDDPEQALPLSVQLGNLIPVGPGTQHLPTPERRRFERTITGLGDPLPPAEAVLYLSLEAGRQDWFYPVRDGVLCEPTPVHLAKGGIIAVCATSSLRYDLSGLRVVQDDRFEQKLEDLRAQGRLLNKKLFWSLAYTGFRAETLPRRYEQAVAYKLGGPYAGMLGGKLGSGVRRFLSWRKT